MCPRYKYSSVLSCTSSILALILCFLIREASAQAPEIVRITSGDCTGDIQEFQLDCDDCTVLEWRINGSHTTPVIADKSIYNFSWTAGGEVSVACDYSLNGVGTTASYPLTIIERFDPEVNISRTPTTNPIAPGTAVTFTATPVEGGATPTFQWYLNNQAQTGETGLQYSNSTLENGDVVRVRMNVAEPCANTPYHDSNEITINVEYTLTPPVVGPVEAIFNTSKPVTATGATGDEVYRWYEQQSGGTFTPVPIGGYFNLPPLLDHKTFYVSKYNTVTGDQSARSPVNVTVIVPPPTSPVKSLNTCGPVELQKGSPPPFIEWYWQGLVEDGYSTNNTSDTYLITEATNEKYFIRAKSTTNIWSDPTEISVTTNPVDLVLTHYDAQNPVVQATNSITLAPGFSVPAGHTFTARITITAECNDIYNWSEEIGYDENGKAISRSKVYFDGLGNTIQNQSIDNASGKVWVSQPLYDKLHQASAATMPAPILESDFIFKKGFVTNPTGQPYGSEDFDKINSISNLPGEINNPKAVGKAAGSLGWYYSSENTLEPFVPTTDFPYARNYSLEGPDPTVATSAAPGDQYKKGSGHEVTEERQLIQAGDLSHYLALRHHFTTSSLPVSGYKYISTDADGKKAVNFLDADGRQLASAIVSGNSYVNWSYAYYNDLGQLMATVAPNGITTTSDDYPPFVTLYKYDHLGRLIESSSPDEGMSQFIYNLDGQIRFSQNQVQREANPQRFSYTNYDYLGRLIESGEYTSTGTNPFVFESHTTLSPQPSSVLNITESKGFAGVTVGENPNPPQVDVRYSDYTVITYDVPGSDFSGGPADQTNLFGEISKTENAISQTWYSYDEFGQVLWTKQHIEGVGDKIIEYSYDYHGDVTQIAYQKGTTVVNEPSEEFYHHYVYDGNQRLSEVYTSRNGVNKTLQAKYIYYLHGSLKRVELANNIQGIDYVYNIDGSLKMINHADPSLDPGKDGLTGEHSNFMTDVFGETLDYNTNDYTGAGYEDGTLTLNAHPEQFSGTVKAVRWHSPTDMHVPRAYAFTYDNLNQMQNADWGNVTGSEGSYGFSVNGSQAYKENIGGYDKNGNISSLGRKGKTGNTLADYDYIYATNTNKLESVTNENNPFLNYEYNAIGQLTKQTEGTNSMEVSYNAYGLVREVKKFESTNLIQRITFQYDDRGDRIIRTVYDASNNALQETYNVNDASGNTIAVYEKVAQGGTLELAELPIYGAGRIAIYKPQVHTTFYEVSDHLGNVRGVIGDPETLIYTATLEDNGQAVITNPRVQEIAYYKNLWDVAEDDHTFANHTAPSQSMPSPTYSAYMHWIDDQPGNNAETKSVGPAIGLKVEPGDVIDLEAWVKYEKKTNYSRPDIAAAMVSILGNNFVGTAAGIDVISKATQVFQNGISLAVGATFPGNGNEGDILPHAYLYYLLFDRNFNPITAGWDRVPSNGGGGFDPGNEAFSEHAKLTIPTVTITEPGYIYVFVANESENTKVWFDDVKVTHQRSTIVAGADYYPFGLVMEDRKITRENYRYGYQGQFSEEDKETGWNAFELRMYDARIGRWISPDPYSQFWSPYLAMGNAPHMYLDSDGGWTGPGGATDDFLKPAVTGAAARFESAMFALASPRMPQLIGGPVSLSASMGGIRPETNIQPPGDFSTTTIVNDYSMRQPMSMVAPTELPVSFKMPSAVSTASIASTIQNAASFAGLIPGLNTVAGIIEAGAAIAAGDYVGAGVAVLGAIPVVGVGVKAAKLSVLALKKLRSARKVGMQAHADFYKILRAKGWEANTRKLYQGRLLGPDGISPDGRFFLELKPKTLSGIAKGKWQKALYEKFTGKHGRVVYYDPVTGKLLWPF